jgi:hypothetical protein
MIKVAAGLAIRWRLRIKAGLNGIAGDGETHRIDLRSGASILSSLRELGGLLWGLGVGARGARRFFLWLEHFRVGVSVKEITCHLFCWNQTFVEEI